MRRSLEITTKIGCANACHFCPQKELAHSYGAAPRMMTLGDFSQIISTVPREIDIDFSGYVEPLFNPEAHLMMLEAKSRGHRVELYTTLMGLTVSAAYTIRELRLDNIRIHVPDTKGMILPDDRWIAVHSLFWRTVSGYSAMAMGPMTSAVEAHMRECGVKVDMPDMLSRGGLLWKPTHRAGSIKCGAQRWHQNVVLPNGDVFACCMDYSLTMPLGNLLRQPYAEIEQRANEYEANHNPPIDSICRTCEWACPI